jgi:hypothetical protein
VTRCGAPTGLDSGEPVGGGTRPAPPSSRSPGTPTASSAASGPPAARLRPARRIGLRISAEQLVFVTFRADAPQRLRLRGTALDQPHGREHVQEELQVFRLPVLRHVDRERRGRQVAAQAHRIDTVGELLVVEVGQTGQRLSHQAGQEEGAEAQREAVVPEERAKTAHRPSTPIRMKYARPPSTTTRYAMYTPRVLIGHRPRSRRPAHCADGIPRR